MSRNLTKYTNDMNGLRRAMFDTLQDLRDGIAKPDEALAAAQVAGRILEAAKLEMAAQDRATSEDRANASRRRLQHLPE